jgi:hypothetical protein
MPPRTSRPQAEFRQFMIEQFGNDPDEYRVVDIADLVSTSENPVLAALTTQQVGDMLRAWARNRQIFQGWTCKESRPPGSHSQSKFRMINRKAAGAAFKSGAPVTTPGGPPVFQGPLVVQDPPPNGHEPASNGNAPTKPSRFSGKIQSRRADGSMLVINDDGAFSVAPVQW